jgi:hypothetical protein
MNALLCPFLESPLLVRDFTDPSHIDYNEMEPEYGVEIDWSDYVSFQDNNSIGIFDLSSGMWAEINNLGSIGVPIR